MRPTLATILLLAIAAQLPAAEVRLKPKAQPAGPIVRVSDVAQVFAATAEELQQLEQLELFPAPVADRRIVRMQEIQSQLRLRGVNMLRVTFTGASQVEVQQASAAEPQPSTPRNYFQDASSQAQLQRTSTRRAEQLLEEATLASLEKHAGGEPYQVEFQLDPQDAELISASGQPIEVAGLRAPWVGQQTLAVTWNGARQPIQVPVMVTIPAMVVVALRPLAKGSLIHEEDVQLQHEPEWLAEKQTRSARSVNLEPHRKLEDVVGHETTKTIPAGQIIDAGMVQRPVYVRRGEVVTVYVRLPGVTVRTNGRAKDDGSLQDQIVVESLLERKTFFAEVTGPQEVQVQPSSIRANDEPRARPLKPTANDTLTLSQEASR